MNPPAVKVAATAALAARLAARLAAAANPKALSALSKADQAW